MRYRSIYVRIWGDEKFRSLSSLKPSAQGLFLYLLTNPNTTSIPGLYRAGAAAMAEELGWSIEGFKGALNELTQHGLVIADLDSRVIFIPNAIKYNKPQSPNVIKSWRSHWDEIPECELKNLAYQKLKAFAEGMGKAFGQAFVQVIDEGSDESIVKPSLKTIPNQEQDQEQEQKKNTVDDPSSNSVTTDVLDSSETQTLLALMVREIFNYWQTMMDHPQAKLDLKRKKKIRAAFNLGFDLEQLKQAIDGCKNTPFNMGENKQKQKYDGIGLIFRDAEQIERFIQNASVCPNNPKLNSTVSQIDQIAEGAI